MAKIKVADLVLDFDLYPRAEVDATHVHYLCDALTAGAKLPAIIADKKSKRVVDGFHRCRAFARVYGDDATADIVFKEYRNDAAIFLDAMRYNAGHGRSLTTFDRTHSILRAEALGISVEQVAEALSLTVDALGALRSDRVGSLKVAGSSSRPIPLKRTIRHMAGHALTKKQAEANEKLSGMEQLFYVNQLITIMEAGLLDESNDKLMAALDRLARLIGGGMKRAA